MEVVDGNDADRTPWKSRPSGQSGADPGCSRRTSTSWGGTGLFATPTEASEDLGSSDASVCHRPGSTGRWPPRLSSARAISASGERKPKAGLLEGTSPCAARAVRQRFSRALGPGRPERAGRGGTQAGTTAMLDCLVAAIPGRDRLVSAEEVFELRFPRPRLGAANDGGRFARRCSRDHGGLPDGQSGDGRRREGASDGLCERSVVAQGTMMSAVTAGTGRPDYRTTGRRLPNDVLTARTCPAPPTCTSSSRTSPRHAVEQMLRDAHTLLAFAGSPVTHGRKIAGGSTRTWRAHDECARSAPAPLPLRTLHRLVVRPSEEEAVNPNS